MLSVRHFLRLCKQSAQCTLVRPSVYFSSSADDSNSKRPPSSEDGNALEALLKTTYSSKTSAQRPKQSQAAAPKKQTSSKKEGKKDSQKIQGDLKETLTPTPEAPAQPPTAEAGTSVQSSFNLKIKKEPRRSANDLLDRLQKIAQEVAGPAGPKAGEVANDLINKLQGAIKASEKPLDISELNFKVDSKDTDKNQGLDLLRNKIVSEEQAYKITPSQEEVKQRWSGSEKYPWKPQQENVRRINVLRDLDVSLHPKIRIGIFTPESSENQITQSCLRTMEKLEQREMNLANSYAPRNWFEQCIKWTEEGKLWHFPINNEQGQEKQASVSFTEHLFLEDHLEGWCPTFGPVRHFMELVCLGLSKNPYLSVEEKLDYIAWYRNYFDKHRDILEAAGTLSTGVTKVPALEAQ